MRIASIIGARPQFIKIAVVSEEIRKTNEEILIHTGQHYDDDMSAAFFDSLNIPTPDYNLGVGSASHAVQTARMMERLEKVLLKESPDLVLVYGDTNSTLAGSLVAAKLRILLGHVEAGLRSFNRDMPEEINRIVSDHVSDMLFCPTKTAVENLRAEGITDGVHLVGDVMYDLALRTAKREHAGAILHDLELSPKSFLLVTLHRPSNTDVERNLGNIVSALTNIDGTVVFPVHPRTMKYLKKYSLLDKLKSKVTVVDPVGYPEFLDLLISARKVLTDSGGVQKEAYFVGTPCITLREETEWKETTEGRWNVLVGAHEHKILKAINEDDPESERKDCFGDGNAGGKIVNTIEEYGK